MMEATEAAALAVEDIARAFGGVRAVAGVSFTVAAGEAVALIGPNGAGKTTCFNLVAGQLRPDRGRVTLAGRDVTGLPPRALCRLGMGRGFQVAQVFSSMTARETVQTALIARAGRTWRFLRAARAQQAAEADALLARVGLGGQGARAARALAYGEVKRLELAIALAADPRVLLLDEPAAGMAAAEREMLAGVLRAVVADGVALLFTEHDMDMVGALARRVLVMERGALIAEGDPARIGDDPRVRRAYLGEA
jgi:branched-chain amino acid transport system ATP-binding protein